MGTKDRCPHDGNTTKGDYVVYCTQCERSFCVKCGLQWVKVSEGFLFIGSDTYGWKDSAGHTWTEVDTIA
jgi:hypothetical protein